MSLINKAIGYSYNDLSIIPTKSSSVNSRKECCPYTQDSYLPIFTAPMASVVSDKNWYVFENNGIYSIIPRNIDLSIRKTHIEVGHWVALSLQEFQDIFISENCDRKKSAVYKICIDIANGHMSKLYNLCSIAKEIAHKQEYTLIIMTGNIANPETYDWITDMNENHNYNVIDYIRVGIGSGSGCITSSNTGIHYPIASLINECSLYKTKHSPKLIADGGIRNYSDVIKALALGADYVMIGSLFAQCIESAGIKIVKNAKNCVFKLNKYKDLVCENQVWYGYNSDETLEYYKNKVFTDQELPSCFFERKLVGKLDVVFFGMASADGQKSISGEKTKTAEGITKRLPVLYTLEGWCNNMEDYLKSAMSYTDCKTLTQFKVKANLIVNSISEINSVNK